MRFGIKEQIIMMEHENERMSYSFEPSDESSGAQGYHQTSYDPNYNQNEHKNPKKKNGVGGRMVALLVAVALVASIGGSALTTVINNISRKNEEANAKAKETMSAQTVEPAQDDSQDTATENSSYSLEKSALPKSLSSNDTGKSLTPKEVYAMNVNATVGIATQITTNVWGQVASASASGSGFILTSDGYVVTNNHVVEGATSVTVKLYNGDEYDAEVIGTDEMNDVALLKIDATGLQAVTIGDSDQIEVGEEVIAIGNPLGELTFTMTAGVVSALDREINTDGKPINMLQTDVAINSGNSGGALFDMNGNVIGITSAKYSGSTSSGASIEGISFAIPINDALRVVYDLQQYGHVTGRAYLGVTVKDLDGTTAATYGLPTGPMIQSVEAGGCAEKAGLQQGDIIIGFNGAEISSYTDLVAALNKCHSGDTATIKVFRGGAEVDATITLDERPTDEEVASQQAVQDQQQSQNGQPGSGSGSTGGSSSGSGSGSTGGSTTNTTTVVDDLRNVLVPTTSEILWGVIDGSLLSTVWNRITSSSGSLLSIGLKQLANITGQPMSTILNFVGGGATYICYVNGSQASFSTSIKYPVLAGGLAVRQNVNGTVKAMIQLMPMKIDKVGAASVMSNGTRYETADDMQVYLWYKGQYYATKLSEVNSEGYYLTGWYDNFGCAAGKRVRVIVAVKKD